MPLPLRAFKDSESITSPGNIFQSVADLMVIKFIRNSSVTFHKKVKMQFRCNNRPEDTYRRRIKLSPKTTGQRLNRVLHAFNRPYQASTFGGRSNIGSTKTLLFSGFDQNAQINLITCKISELMAGSQYPQTTRSLLETGLLLLIEL